MNSLSSSLSEDEVLAQLLEYCKDQDIYISSCISPRRFPGRGLGIYATEPISRGQRLMHVPTAALLTVEFVPDTFISQIARESLSVHGLLAAYLAFGLGSDQENPYSRWTATWPTLADFVTTMPMFWPYQRSLPSDKNREETGDREERQAKKPRHEKSPSPDPSKSHPSIIPSAAQAFSTHQLHKLHSSLETLSNILPRLSSITNPHHTSYWKFVHAWCSVNTRCFYYLRPSQPPPEDSNEAMALCPGMDLFNHTDTTNSGCTTYYDADGYSVVADRAYKAGEEVLLSYGQHNNDTLWTEYGFLMQENADDAIRIDEIVLRDVGMREKGRLEEEGYLGEYWLREEGVCWRTEVVVWMGVLDEERWRNFVKGEYDPESEFESDRRMTNGDKDETKHVLRAKRRIGEWISKVKKDAEQGLRALASVNEKELSERLAEDAAQLKAQNDRNHIEVEKVKVSRVQQRKEMCVQRWKQMWEISTTAAQALEKDYPGSLPKREEGMEEELKMTADDFWRSLGSSKG